MSTQSKAAKAAVNVIRVAMHKSKLRSFRSEIVDQYKLLAQTQSRDGKPYILSLSAGEVHQKKSSGATFTAVFKFKTWDDLRYFEASCPAHRMFREWMKKRQVHKKIGVIVYRELVCPQSRDGMTTPDDTTPEDASSETSMSWDAVLEANELQKSVTGRRDKETKSARGPFFM